jgi:hypothetical protein
MGFIIIATREAFIIIMEKGGIKTFFIALIYFI